MGKLDADILAIDVGNTSTLFGHFHSGRLVKSFRLLTPELVTARLNRLKKEFPLSRIRCAVIASVVPQAERLLRRVIPKRFHVKTLSLGREIRLPIKNKARYPGEVGVDRLVNALAAYRRYGREAIVVDFGTAITFDVISRKGEYLGGVIAPGIEISLEALYQKTALLPKISLVHPRRVIGRDTVECIRIGCSFGIGGLCDRIITEITDRHRFQPVVVATGGYAKFMAKYSKKVDRIDNRLTINGIWLAYEEGQKKT